ncbi:hypothetical protein [Streptomyces roseolilacinus]|uniref:PLL-like beta propeller domain-containing protein n=1 Tax=Streptomyces roseolilacinus TaxID=66904 RepID=A0A918B5F9_9ACTN|nr:hypothetical protein [Streptomyces roseolilacinus]GGQ21302.1 hypothetical protein GCM10010249_45000 [Streptomyces roseolilacinus]
MRRFRSALAATAALAAFAGLGAAAAPAQAATYCTNKGQKYLCEYGVSTTKFLNGTKEEFVVGADHAVWTNWTHPDGSWNGWVSMGGWVQSRVNVDPEETSRTLIVMSAIGKDGNRWFRMRHTNGYWTEWQVSCHVEPNGPNCP